MKTVLFARRSRLGGRSIAVLFSAAILLPLLSSSTLHAEEDSDSVRPERGQRAAPREGRSERRAEMRKRMLKKFDADGDGQLNDEERAALRKGMADRRGRGKKGDGKKGFHEGNWGPGKRGDGKKGLREGKQGPGKGARDWGPKSRRHGPHDQGGPPDLDKLFEKFDRDGDDRLDRDEFKAALHVLRKMHQRRMGQVGEGRRGGPGPGRDRDGFRPRHRPDREGRSGPPPKHGHRHDRD